MNETCVRCFVCGWLILSEEDLLIVSAGWEEEFQVPCHRDCGPEDRETPGIRK